MNVKASQDNRKTIGIVAHNLDFGGAATACKRLAAAFSQEGHEVITHLVSGKASGANNLFVTKCAKIRSAVYSRLDQVFCKLLEPSKGHWSSSGLIGQIKSKTLVKGAPAFINVHWIGHATISLRQISKIDMPVLITAHDEWWLTTLSHYSGTTSNVPRDLIRKHILKYIKNKKIEILKKHNVGIACLSREMLEQFLFTYPYLHGRIRVIPNPVDNSIYHPLKLIDQLSSVPTAAYLGGFGDKRKGYDLLLESLEKCKENFNVLATGFNGELLSGDRKQIRIIGISKISNESELNNLYNSAEITIVPSRQEALPQVATESLMSGTPVISFRVGGLRDIVIDGETGVTVENFDISEFTSKLDKFMSSSAKRNLKPEIFAIENFSQSVVVEKYLNFYKILNRRQK